MSAAIASPENGLRRRLYALLEGEAETRGALILHASIIGLILVSVAAVILESVPSLGARFGRWFEAIELFAGVAFTAEYLARLWSAVEHAPLRGKSPEDFKVLLIFRLVRFFKLARYSPGMRSLMEAVVEERRALLACLVILCGLMIVAASAMHVVEGAAQPDKFGSIPESMWWAIITLTTVGYGDSFPITPLGKMVAGVTALFGLVMLALPVGIVATAFSDVIRRREFVVTWAMVAQVPLFAKLNAQTLASLLPVMRSRMAEAGETIVRRGLHEDCMYAVISGRVEEVLPKGRHMLTEGHCFAEEAVLADEPCHCTVRALERTRLLAIDRHEFLALLEREPALREEIEAALAKRRPAETP
jgi:voltage-gated potassium channel